MLFRSPVRPEERQSQLKQLIALGKEQSYLTYAQVNDFLPAEIVDPEQIEEIVNTINDMGIPVYEKAPDSESLLVTEATAPSDEEAVEEAAAALAALAIPRERCRTEALRYTWAESARQFYGNIALALEDRPMRRRWGARERVTEAG